MDRALCKINVAQFFQEDSLIDLEVQAILSDPESADELAKEVAKAIISHLEGSLTTSQGIVHAAFGNPEFKKMVMNLLSAEQNN